MGRRRQRLGLAPAQSQVPPGLVATGELPQLIDAYLLAGEVRRLSPETTKERRGRLDRLVWFLRDRKFLTLDRAALEAFFAYLQRPLDPGAHRWGETSPSARRNVGAQTARNYLRCFSTFTGWLEREGRITESPLAKIQPPKVPNHQIQPFSEDHLKLLFAAARGTCYPRRDQAILALMLDTGLRAAELCRITVGDIDLIGCQVVIKRGKGGKSRVVGFGPGCRSMIHRYLAEDAGRLESDPLFVSASSDDGHLTIFGLLSLFKRLEATSGITGVRVSPHTMRHTFAIMSLRSGRLSEFSLRVALGHSSLAVTQKYCEMARADVVGRMRQDSPLDGLLGPSKRGRKKAPKP